MALPRVAHLSPLRDIRPTSDRSNFPSLAKETVLDMDDHFLERELMIQIQLPIIGSPRTVGPSEVLPSVSQVVEAAP